MRETECPPWPKEAWEEAGNQHRAEAAAPNRQILHGHALQKKIMMKCYPSYLNTILNTMNGKAIHYGMNTMG